MPAALELATIAGGGISPIHHNPIIDARLNEPLPYNKHFHVYWQHFDTHGNLRVKSEVPLNTHIFYGEIRFQGRIIRR